MWSKLSYLRVSNVLSGYIEVTISLFLICFMFVNCYIYDFFFLLSIAMYSPIYNKTLIFLLLDFLSLLF